ncbi:hypothetical protein TPHA_0E01060 [Tetrapisispora phaffii CBS 4417]|uniref:Uncharacterized protein n=1 Tax=Tetrapisispora phaffii (strain ATCC 24235 / CBS 4417 / NBRC 1672 / NRRL Y-8282 / UCD 70-5) TaxID=1071381 RepID=G8BTH2_TETPH|nr:hypothetical protein TPHA_0E01060 [Tetrapisispora phaffii CBS 4417]CCE63200.1 hypothetical protein TPHA_0E01060 [Tetrapisispora phaffii CBS 4417]
MANGYSTNKIGLNGGQPSNNVQSVRKKSNSNINSLKTDHETTRESKACVEFKTSLSKLSHLTRERNLRQSQLECNMQTFKTSGVDFLKDLFKVKHRTINFNNKFTHVNNKNNNFNNNMKMNNKSKNNTNSATSLISPILTEVLHQKKINNTPISFFDSLWNITDDNINNTEFKSNIFSKKDDTQKLPIYNSAFEGPKQGFSFSPTSPTTTLIHSELDDFYEHDNITFIDKLKLSNQEEEKYSRTTVQKNYETQALLNRIQSLENEIEYIRVEGNGLLDMTHQLEDNIYDTLYQRDNDSSNLYLDNDYRHVDHRQLGRKINELSWKLSVYKDRITKYANDFNESDKCNLMNDIMNISKHSHQKLEKITNDELKLIEESLSSDSDREVNSYSNSISMNEVTYNYNTDKLFEFHTKRLTCDANTRFDLHNTQKTGFNIKLKIKKQYSN